MSIKDYLFFCIAATAVRKTYMIFKKQCIRRIDGRIVLNISLDYMTYYNDTVLGIIAVSKFF